MVKVCKYDVCDSCRQKHYDAPSSPSPSLPIATTPVVTTAPSSYIVAAASPVSTTSFASTQKDNSPNGIEQVRVLFSASFDSLFSDFCCAHTHTHTHTHTQNAIKTLKLDARKPLALTVKGASTQLELQELAISVVAASKLIEATFEMLWYFTFLTLCRL
jgi:hypothetical protein